MIADVVLGNNIDTIYWVNDLKANGSENIILIDYDYIGELQMINGIVYISSREALAYIQKFDSVSYYKSIYILPRMSKHNSF